MITDLTQGKPFSVIWRYSLPMLLSVAFQQIYNIADSIIAGKCINEDALASVGASYPITMLFIAVATGMTAGCSVVISQQFGAKNYESTKTAISTGIISTLALSLILTFVGVIICNPVMNLIDTPKNIFDDSSAYLRIYIFGIAGLFLYNICNATFTALGDSRTPLIFLIVSSIGNIILDLVFVITFDMGVQGVAWATLIAQCTCASGALITLLFRIKKIKSGKFSVFSGVALKKIARISIPSILQQSFVSVGNIFVQRLINGYGSSCIAGYSAAIKLNTFAVVTMSTMSNALSNFTAQNIGAGQIERVKKGFRSAAKIAFISAVAFTCTYLIFRKPLITMFLEKEDGKAAISAGALFLLVVSPFYIVICLKLLCDGVLRGAGMMSQFMASTFLDLLLRVVLAYAFSAIIGSEIGIWLSWPLGWILAACCSFFFYHKGGWRNRGAI